MIKCGCGMDGRTVVAGKLAVVAFVFIVLNLWTALADWVQATNVWLFVIVFVILAVIVGGSCDGSAVGPTKKVRKVVRRKKKK